MQNHTGNFLTMKMARTASRTGTAETDRRQRRFQPRVETLEARLALDAAAPPNVFPVPAAVANLGLTNSQFISDAFQSILGRAADAGALSSFANSLESGELRGQVAAAITHSAEYFAGIVETTYQQYLNRAADPVGLQYWVGQMEAGLSNSQLAANFMASDEFFHSSGANSQAWIDALYGAVLHRAADTAGANYWLQQLAGGASRDSISLAFTTSVESEAAVISQDYEQYLHRAASAPDLASWIQAYQNGSTNENIIADIVGSKEFSAI